MALAWLLQQKEVTSVLIGASKTQQILDNIKAISSAPLTEEELKLIDEISLKLKSQLWKKKAKMDKEYNIWKIGTIVATIIALGIYIIPVLF